MGDHSLWSLNSLRLLAARCFGIVALALVPLACAPSSSTPPPAVYVTINQGNTGIVKITPAGVASVIAGGTQGCCGSSDGFGPAARFGAPQGLAIGPGFKLYVTDHQQESVRLVQ